MRLRADGQHRPPRADNGEGEPKLHGAAVQASHGCAPRRPCVVAVSPPESPIVSLRIATAEFITSDTRARHNDGPPLDPLSTYGRTTPQLPVTQTRKASPPAVSGPAGRRAPAAVRAATDHPHLHRRPSARPRSRSRAPIGSARGYQELFAPLANHHGRAGRRPGRMFYASPALGVTTPQAGSSPGRTVSGWTPGSPALALALS